MRTWLANWWHALSTSFWFVPGLFLLAGLGLALLIPELDDWYQERGGYVPDSLRTTATTARATLTALCGAMFTVTGVVFSTTTVALSITSNQLGPRLLRNFLQQLVTQVTLGVCLASSVYCLTLLRRVDKLDESLFIPHGALLLASVLGLVTLMTVVYFTHRVVHSMQAQNVVSDVADDLDVAVQRLFPERIGRRQEEAEDEASEEAYERAWRSFDEVECAPVESDQDGYLQAIDDAGLMQVASELDLCLRVHARPGDYLREREPLLDATPADRLDEEAACRMQRMFLVGNLRTTQQDVECAVNELVEVGIRALSPGINDPFTAIACVDRLSSALRKLAGRRPPSGVRADPSGETRLVVRPRRFAAVVDAAFNQLRQHAKGDVAVTVRLLDAIASVSSVVESGDDLGALKEQADMIAETARGMGFSDRDLRDIEASYGAFDGASTDDA